MRPPSEIAQYLRLTGHRLTSPREHILAVIHASDGHITAEQILKRVRARYGTTNKSSVYRTLDLLTRLDLVNPTDFGNGRIEYEIHRHPHHHHLLCRDCRAMLSVAEEVFAPLAKTLRGHYGFDADLEHFVIYGLCRACAQAARRPRQRRMSSKRGTKGKFR